MKVFCKRCGNYGGEDDFYISVRTDNGRFRAQHKRKLCVKKKVRTSLLWEEYLNPKVIKESNLWYEKNKEKIHAYNRMGNKVRILAMHDPYIKQLLKEQGFTDKDLDSYPELINIKKEIVKINRLTQKKRL